MMSERSRVFKDKLLYPGASWLTRWLSKACWSYGFFFTSNFFLESEGEAEGGDMLVWTCSLLRLTEHSLYHFPLHSWEARGGNRGRENLQLKKAREKRMAFTSVTAKNLFRKAFTPVTAGHKLTWGDQTNYTQRREELAGERECKRESS